MAPSSSSDHQEVAIGGQQKTVTAARKLRIPLAAMLLGEVDSQEPPPLLAVIHRLRTHPNAFWILFRPVTTMIIAAAIAAPVAVLAYNVMMVLKKNYIRQVKDKITTSVAAVYDLIAANGSNLSIRKVLDVPGPSNVSIDFATELDLLYLYEKSIETSDFVVSAGFAVSGSASLCLVGKPGQYGVVCNGNLTSPYGRDCSTLIVTAVNNGYLNLTLDSATQTLATPDPVGTVTGVWDQRVAWIVIPFLDPPLMYGAYGLSWANYALGTQDPNTHYRGWQEAVVTVTKITELLREIETTKNTAIAVWQTGTGELIGTNGIVSTLDADDTNGYKSYRATNYPNQYISFAATSLIAKYGNFSLMPNTTSDSFDLSGKHLCRNPGHLGRARSLLDDMHHHSRERLAGTHASFEEEGDRDSLCDSGHHDPLRDGQHFCHHHTLPETNGKLAGKLPVHFRRVMGDGGSCHNHVAHMLPYRDVQRVMLAATEMDFSALTAGYLHHTSRVREVAIMEQVFSTMLMRFAMAIDRNRQLMGVPERTGGTNLSSETSVGYQCRDASIG
ncbi:hypothetical protein HKX48_000304 [Thoreauomyces humboldtii]|nr:hypothetical protein HKX48_000304 [Thoreauomyces humboldtii]